MSTNKSLAQTIIVVGSLFLSLLFASLALGIWQLVTHEKVYSNGYLLPGAEAVDLIGVWAGFLLGSILSARLELKSLVSFVGLRFRQVDLLFLFFGIVLQLVLVNALYFPFEKLFHGLVNEVNKTAVEETHLLNGVWLVVIGFFIIVVAPIIEEIFFRGIVLNWAKNITKKKLYAASITSLIFAIMHFSPIEIPALFLLGLSLCYLRFKYNRLGPCIFTHMGFNLLAMVLIR